MADLLAFSRSGIPRALGCDMAFRTLVLIAGLLVAPRLAGAQCEPPASAIDDWQLAAPASVGMDGEKLCALIPIFEKYREGNLHAVLVVRHGKLVFERYFTGTDAPIDGAPRTVTFDANAPHDIRSITKSVAALVLGIAVDRGWVADIDLPVLSFFPEHADLRTPEKDRITLRHLLTMSQGLAWNDAPWKDPANSERQMWESKAPPRYVLEQPVVAVPGEKFVYSGGSAVLIAAILRKQTGRDLDTLAQTELFRPLGIEDVEWFRYRVDGDVMADGGLRMRPRDLAKIGQLMLDRGRWNGAQIVSAAWIDAASTRHQRTPLGLDYGYQFWIGRSFLDKGGDVTWAAGMGLGGQRLFIVPSLGLVAVVHAGLYERATHRSIPEGILNRYILPSVDLR